MQMCARCRKLTVLWTSDYNKIKALVWSGLPKCSPHQNLSREICIFNELLSSLLGTAPLYPKMTPSDPQVTPFGSPLPLDQVWSV